MINLIVADNSELVQIGLSSIFSDCADISVVGLACDEHQLLELTTAESNAMVMIDFTATGFSVDTIVSLKQNKKRFVLAITPEKSGPTIISALKAGVSGYVKKDCSKQEIIDAVRAIGEGDQFFCGQILEAIRNEKIDPQDADHVDFSCAPVNISKRELEIIGMIAEGRTNSQIADMLFLSGHTVNTHRRNIMQKLGVNNTAAVVLYAVKMGIVSPNRFLFSPESTA
jgi:DNA-binding NarL/FixJ family response regulator